MKKPVIKQTLPDKVVAWWDPSRAARRMQDRMRMALAQGMFASGSYDGASKSRRPLISWLTSGGDADADTLDDVPTIRERSRDLVRNNPLAAGAIHNKVGNVVGSGLRLNAQIDAEYLGLSDEQAAAWEANTEREFALWAESQDCDVARTLNFYEQQDMVFRSTLESGDAFVLLPYVERANSPYSLALQVVEADRVCNQNWARNTDRLAGGVRKDANGAPIEYHILKQHPGSVSRTSASWDVVRAFGQSTGRRNVLHLYRKLRPGQTRGVPDLAPVIESLKQLGDYTEAELTAAVVSGLFTVFIKTEGGESFGGDGIDIGTQQRVDRDAIKMGYGQVVDLATNESIETANPGRPNAQFDPFFMAIATQIGIALEMPREVLLMSFNSSYSASKAAIEQVWTFFRARRSWLINNFCRPVYAAWMEEAVALGRIYAPGFLRDPAIRAAYLGSTWNGPTKQILDLTKEVSGRMDMEDRGWITAGENTNEMTGGDWKRKHRTRVNEERLRTDAGMGARGEASRQPPPPPEPND